MGLFSVAKKAFKKIVKPAARRLAPAIGGAILGVEGAQLARQVVGEPSPRLPALPPGLAAPTVLRPRRGLPRSPVTGMPIIPTAGMACPPGFHPAKDGSGRCVRNRRMNPMNPRAAMRAIRRIKAVRKMLMRIERQLPKQRTTRRAPAGHRARLTHE